MSPQDKADFGRLITDALAFQRQDVTDFGLSVWWQACRRFSLEQVSRAITAHITDPERGRFPLTPSDIVRVLAGTHTDRALVAWGKVHEAIGRVGSYTDVVFDDPVIHAVVDDMGGWVAVCQSKVDELAFVQKRFCDTYRTYATRGTQGYSPVLMGICGLANRQDGRDTAPPALVGDSDRCLEVMRAGSAHGRLSIKAADALAIGMTRAAA